MRTTTTSNPCLIRRALLAGAVLCALVMGACKQSSVPLGSDTGGKAGDGGSDPCPSAAAAASLDGMSCSSPSDAVCAWQHEDGGWQACACGCRREGEWACYTQAGSGSACPLVQPEEGGSCIGYEGAECRYFPDVLCSCNVSSHDWVCLLPDPAGHGHTCLWPGVSVSSPAGIDGSTPINVLTRAQAEALCQWLDTSNFHWVGDPPESSPVDPDGTVWGYAALGCKNPAPMCIERLSLEHCVANLELHDCTATVHELVDCVQTMMNGCTIVGEGCGAWLANPSCSQTYIGTLDAMLQCHIPVQ